MVLRHPPVRCVVQQTAPGDNEKCATLEQHIGSEHYFVDGRDEKVLRPRYTAIWTPIYICVHKKPLLRNEVRGKVHWER